METQNLGRLVRTLKSKCPICSNPMQLRARKVSQLVRGEETFYEEDYEACSVCDYEQEIEQRKRKERFDKTAYVKEPLEEKKEKHGGYKGRSDIKNSTRNRR